MSRSTTLILSQDPDRYLGNEEAEDILRFLRDQGLVGEALPGEENGETRYLPGPHIGRLGFDFGQGSFQSHVRLVRRPEFYMVGDMRFACPECETDVADEFFAALGDGVIHPDHIPGVRCPACGKTTPIHRVDMGGAVGLPLWAIEVEASLTLPDMASDAWAALEKQLGPLRFVNFSR